MPEKVAILHKFNEELHSLVDIKLQQDIQEENDKKFFISFIMAKAYKTHEAILLLCRNGYGEDAFMLARTLFELMITLAYVLQDNTDGRLERYMDFDWVTRKEMYDYIATHPQLLMELKKVLEAKGQDDPTEEVEREYKKAMDRYGYRNGWSDKSIMGMAEVVGRLDMYSTVYRLQCTVSHTNARSMNDYIIPSEEGMILNVGSNWDLAENSLVIIFDCFYHIILETNTQFSWDLGKALEELRDRYVEMVRKLKN